MRRLFLVLALLPMMAAQYGGDKSNTTPASGGGSPAYVTSAVAHGAFATNPATTITITLVAGNQLLVWGTAAGAGSLTGLTTPTGCSNTYTAQGTPTTGAHAQGLWWVQSIASSGSCTIALAASSSAGAGLTGGALELSAGTITGSVLGTYGTSASCSTTCTGSGVTPSSINNIVVTFLAVDNTSTLSAFAPTGTTAGFNGADSAGDTVAILYYSQSTAALYTPTWTSSGPLTFTDVSIAIP